MDFGDAVSSLGASITSPAKLAFIGFCVLVYADKIKIEEWEFVVFAIVFFIFQVLHDDFARILLNKRAELQADKARRRAGFPERAPQ